MIFMNYFRQMKADKERYKKEMQRVKVMPKSYQIVFHEVEHYLYNFADGDGMDMVEEIYRLIDMFEEGVANDIPVLDFVGEDVGEFAEDYLHEIQVRKWSGKMKNKVNQNVKKKLEALDDEERN